MIAKLQSTFLFDDRGIPYLLMKDSLFYDFLAKGFCVVLVNSLNEKCGYQARQQALLNVLKFLSAVYNQYLKPVIRGCMQLMTITIKE